MNFLNNDFDISGETKSASDLRDYYLSTIKRPQSSLLSGELVNSPGFHGSGFRVGKAGPFGTLLWHTIILGERSARNYSRNLLAYGVRAGMYAGRFLLMSIR